MSEPVTFDVWAQEKIDKIEDLLSNSQQENKNYLEWFSTLKQIITAADNRKVDDNHEDEKNDIGECIYADYADDNERFHATDITDQFTTKTVRWTIRVKAFRLVHRLVSSLGLKHLPDIVRLSFVSATSPYDELKLEGFKMFEYIINRFAFVEEKEIPGHSIVEQYKTQVISAINPALDLEAPPYITAIACRVLCLWICRNLETESNGFKRAHELMLKTLYKLENQSTNQNSKLYTESELEQERLDILGSWAQIYVKSFESNEWKKLIEPQVESLVDNWWEALKEYALLIIPKLTQKDSDMTNPNGLNYETVYTRQVALSLFANVWYKIVLAVTHWLCSDPKIGPKSINEQNSCDKYIKFISGILMKQFCNHSGDQVSDATRSCIASLLSFLGNDIIKIALSKDQILVQEFYIALYTIIIRIQRNEISFHVSQCLEQLFKLHLDVIIASNSNDLDFIISSVCDHLMDNLNQLNTASTSNIDVKNNRLTIKKNISFRITNLINSLIYMSHHVIPDDIKKNVIKTIEMMISYKDDPTIRIMILNAITKLNPLNHKDQIEFLRENLYSSKIETLAHYSNTLDKNLAGPEAECLMKSIKLDIQNSDNELSYKILSQLLESLLVIPGQDKSGGQRNELPGNMHEIKQLRSEFPQLFDKIMQENTKLNNHYSDLENTYQLSIKGGKIDEKSKSLTQSDSLATRNSLKPKTKIVLKTDFGNFYQNKGTK